jgi:glycosyltransferase involved in cell wall biosynthesis
MDPNEFNKVVELVLKQMNRYVSKNCSAFTTLTDAVLPELTNRHPSLPILHKTIPTCVDLNKFLVSEFEKKDAIHFLLLGNFNMLYDTTRMYSFLSELRTLEKVEILWAHDSNVWDRTNPLCTFDQTSVPHFEVPNLIRQSHVGLLFLKDSKDLSLLAAMPTKIAEFWASGRPIIISKGVGDVDSLIEEYKIGLSVEDSMSSQEILVRLQELIQDSETPNRCRFVAEKFFSIDNAAQSYLDIFEQIVK